MTPTLLLIASLALLLIAGALWLWSVGAAQQTSDASARFIDQQLQQRRPHAHATPPGHSATLRLPAGPTFWQSLLLQAGQRPSLQFYILLDGVPLLLALTFGLLVHPLSGLLLGLMLFGLQLLLLWRRAAIRRQRMAAQLPDFLESMVRLLTIGNSLGAAFQSALHSVEPPLRDALDRIDSLVRSGKDLDSASKQVAAQYRMHELYLVAAIIGIALQYGGRSDQVLERMALFMRDLHQARHEMRALSAETRLSAWILAILPLAIAAYTVIVNGALFMNMWHDPLGGKLLLLAAFLQIAGTWWLYRLARAIQNER